MTLSWKHWMLWKNSLKKSCPSSVLGQLSSPSYFSFLSQLLPGFCPPPFATLAPPSCPLDPSFCRFGTSCAAPFSLSDHPSIWRPGSREGSIQIHPRQTPSAALCTAWAHVVQGSLAQLMLDVPVIVRGLTLGHAPQ